LDISDVFTFSHDREPSFDMTVVHQVRQSDSSVADVIILAPDIFVPKSELDRILAAQLNFKDFIPDWSFAHVVCSSCL